MLKNLLENNRAAVIKSWKGLIIETYPARSQGFLNREKDRFANPVGTTIAKEVENVFSELIGQNNPETLASCLDNIIRIRAVQEFSPSRAVSFVFLLKAAIRQELGDKIRQDDLLEELSELESKIDETALAAFDVYMGCREKIYEIKANEIKNRSSILLKRASRDCDDPECECAPVAGDARTKNDKKGSGK